MRESAPDIVLIDLNLPDLSGFDVLAQLDAVGPRPRCVALTADALPATLERARRAGFDAVLTKPIDVDALVRALDGLLRGARDGERGGEGAAAPPRSG